MRDFPTNIEAIEQRIRSIDPVAYASGRNFVNGAVTYLSPYISRGVISTLDVLNHLKTTNTPWYKMEKLIQELAWRDYFQQVWISIGDDLHSDIKNTQDPVSNYRIPGALLNASTSINAIDDAINSLFETGYMHNHMRMYVASIACNIAQSHWLQPARWMYYHLLDGDLASNQLSWQWVAGAFANKKYYANQDNINKYFQSDQKNTFLDVGYEEFASLPIPRELEESSSPDLQTSLPEIDNPKIDLTKSTLIYNYYNLDPYWHMGEDFQRIVLLEPSVFEKFPVSKKCLDFALELTKNIGNAQVFVGEFEELQLNPNLVIYKEHPLNTNCKGNEESRNWMSSVQGYFPSFFAFWKKCKKEIKF